MTSIRHTVETQNLNLKKKISLVANTHYFDALVLLRSIPSKTSILS